MVSQSTRHPESYDENFIRRLDIISVAEVGIISLIAVLGLLAVVLVRASKQYKKRHAYPTDRPLFQPASVFFMAAIVMDGVQAIGSSLSIRWALRGQTLLGSYCTIQGMLRQCGNTGAALLTIAISITTYISAVRSVPLTTSRSNWIVAIVVGLILLFLFLTILIPTITITRYYYPSRYSEQTIISRGLLIISHISNEQILVLDQYYEGKVIGLLYIYQWIAALVSTISYGLIIRHYLREASAGRRRIRDAVVMGWYPISYVAQILPITIMYFMDLRPNYQHDYSIIAGAFAAASGLINVVLWNLTGRHFGFSKDDNGSTVVEQIGGRAGEVLPLNRVAVGDIARSSTGTRSIDWSESATLIDLRAQPHDPDEKYDSRK